MKRWGSAILVGMVLVLLLVALTSATPTQAEPKPAQQAVEPAACAGHRGKLTLLRVHNVGTGYGPPNDYLDVEVVVWLDTEPNRAFGFQLRNDNSRPVRQGMLDLLRDAFDYNWTVDIDECDGVVFRVWLTKP